MNTTTLSDADVAYVNANYRSLAEVCREHGDLLEDVRALVRERRLPGPSYLLPDGSEMVPADYFDLVDEAGGPDGLRVEFARRHRAAGGPAGELEDDWRGYVDGIYGVCLRSATPETIVRKGQLVDSIGSLLEHAKPADPRWAERLREEVDELDALEREFSPDYDRWRFGRPPSRDALITGARREYPDVFAAEVGSRGR